MTLEALKTHIYQKEISLLEHESRASSAFLNEILTDDFIEFGSSGHTHRKADVLAWLQKEEAFDFEVTNFDSEQLSEQVILAKYTIRMGDSYSIRSSIWIYSKNRWMMKFHQGTKITQHS